MNRRPSPRAARGFTLIEVLVAMLVVAIGLLGIAKMQALALSSTGVASMRSIAAIEASSLAASMHANRVFWNTGGIAAAGVTISGTTIGDPILSKTPVDCTTGGGAAPTCTPTQLAAYDVQQWAAAVNAVLPAPVSTLTCTNVGPPVNCTIVITWGENAVAVNQQGTSTVGATFNVPTYTLYVQP